MTDTKKIELLTRKLIDFNTENYDDSPSGYTLDLLKFVQYFLADSGIKSKIHRYDLERIVGGEKIKLGKRGILISAFDNKKPIVLFQGHADTVPIARKFEGNNCLIKKDIIYGRGAVDMKSSLAAMALALTSMSKQKNLTYQPILLITSDEEAGSFAGIKKFLELYKKEKIAVAFAICGEATDFAIKKNLLGAIYLRFIFKGRSGHAANKKYGENAIEKTVPFLNDLMIFQEKIEQEKNNLGTAVMNIGVIRGGIKVNQIPMDCEIEVSLRSIKKNSIYEKELREIAKRHGGKMERIFSYDPVAIASRDDFTSKLSASSNRIKNEITVMKEFTEATLLNNAGIETVVFGPGNPLLNHSDQEQIQTEDIAHYQDTLEKFILSISNIG